MMTVGLSLPLRVCLWSDVPSPDDEILSEIIDHGFFAEDLRIEMIAEDILVVVKIDQQWTTLEQMSDTREIVGRE